MHINEFLGLLRKVRRSKPNQWTASCPAHEDRNPSLSVKSDAGKILLFCHSGCGAADIVQSLGLTFTDLMPESTDYQAAPWWAQKTRDERERLITLLWVADCNRRKGIRPSTEDIRNTTAAYRRLVDMGLSPKQEIEALRRRSDGVL